MTRALGVELVFMSVNFNAGELVIIPRVPTDEYNGNPSCIDYVCVVCQKCNELYTVCVIAGAEVHNNVFWVGRKDAQLINVYANSLIRFSDIRQYVNRISVDKDVVDPDVVDKLNNGSSGLT